MTKQEIADEIRKTISTLNEQIHAAKELGLEVSIIPSWPSLRNAEIGVSVCETLEY